MRQPLRKELNVFCNFLKNSGLSITSQRKKILEATYRNHGHFEAEDIVAAMRKNRPRVSRATVYRTLQFLEKSKLIRRMEVGNGRTLYEHVWGHEHHEHLYCRHCGKIVEVVNSRLEALIEQIAEQHSFTHAGHRVRIVGVCEECTDGQTK